MYFDVNGKKVFATTGGKAFRHRQPVIIFLHGSALDHTFWGLHARFFAFRNYAVLVPDLPGHTNSQGPALDSIEHMADWLNAVITVLEVKNIPLVAHSQGCLTALEFASRYPRLLRSVSFIASGLETPVNAALIDAAENNPEAAIAMMISWGFGPAGHLFQGPIPGNSMMASGRKVMGINVPEALATDLIVCNSYQNGAMAAANIRTPVQVILGGRDRMAPRNAGMKLADALPDPKLDIIRSSGHMVPLEAPNICRNLLKKFIFSNNPAT